MANVTIYRIENYNASRAITFSLRGVTSFEFVGEVTEDQYSLPEGYEVAESNAGSLEIYDKSGALCTLDTLLGKPLLRTPVHGNMVLSPVRL